MPNCKSFYRNWAFAMLKEPDLCRAVKKIKIAIEEDPGCAENWVIWGLIMRTNGDFLNAINKFEIALKINP